MPTLNETTRKVPKDASPNEISDIMRQDFEKIYETMKTLAAKGNEQAQHNVESGDSFKKATAAVVKEYNNSLSAGIGLGKGSSSRSE